MLKVVVVHLPLASAAVHERHQGHFLASSGGRVSVENGVVPCNVELLNGCKLARFLVLNWITVSERRFGVGGGSHQKGDDGILHSSYVYMANLIIIC